MTGRNRSELGVPGTVEESFVLSGTDTVEPGRSRHREVCAASRAAAAAYGLDEILREQVVTARPVRPQVG